MHLWAVILAAGASSRLAAAGVTTPKQFLFHKGVPLFWHAARTFARVPAVRGVVFVLPRAGQGEPPSAAWPEGDSSGSGSAVCAAKGHGPEALSFAALETAEGMIATLDKGGSLGVPWRVTLGGERRQDSVFLGLRQLPPACDTVLVHDAARPFASPHLIARVAVALEAGHGAVIPGIAVADTIKTVDDAGLVLCTHARASLRAVQTPQGFSLGLLRAAHERACLEGWDVTDDAALLERCGVPVMVVPGETGNVKITLEEDLAVLQQKGLDGSARELPCTGFGYDVHRYGGERSFILGGVPIATDVTIAAHSDGDVLMHALIDALLGCIGGGDIGTLFPDTDPAFDGIESGILLAEVMHRLEQARFRLTHVDVTVVAQAPRIAPHREAIARNLAKLLRLPLYAVNVKATTEERLGFTGEKKGIKAMAVATGLRAVPE